MRAWRTLFISCLITFGAAFATPQANTPVDQGGLLQWTEQVSPLLYTYDSQHYQAQLQTLQGYFSQHGWQTFYAGLQKSNNLNSVTQRHLQVYASTTAPAHIMGQEVTESGQHWFVSIPMNVFYENTQLRAQQSIALTLVLTQQPIDLLSPERPPYQIEFATAKQVADLKIEKLHWCHASR